VEFKNNNLSILTSSIFNIKNMDKNKIDEIIKQAEADANNDGINDQDKYLVNQKIDTLKTLN
jgi:F-type H+-transporting ATPase subunit epsilon/F-type H+-transporting ATPase subunit delta